MSKVMKIAVVTDSTADIPTKLAELHAIHVIPAVLVIDGESYEDGKGLSRSEFYEKMPLMTSPPTTATPSVGVFQRLYENLLNSGTQEIISIHVSSLLSGIFNTAQIAAQAFTNRVRVIDSGQLSLGLGYQALAAAEAIIQGFDIEQVLRKVESVRQRVRVIAMLDTLEYVHRSGRVSWARARIGSLLQIKPFLEVREGQVLSLGQARSRRKGIKYLVTTLKEFGRLDQLGILHTNAEADANELAAQLDDVVPGHPMIVNVTTIVGTHVGPNGLGFAAITH
jgi:DegV family protein with EDD domain